MNRLKIGLLVLTVVFFTSVTFGQSEKFKPVVNNLALYQQKKDLKFLNSAKKSIDSLIKTHADSIDLENNVYRAVVYSGIAYVDSLNTLKQPANFFDQTVTLVDKISAIRRIYKYEAQIDFCKRCLANVYIRKGFEFVRRSDYGNAIQQFTKAQKYVPTFKELDGYIAYSNNKLGNLQQSVRFYDNLLRSDSTKVAYIQTTADIYKSLGDTTKALQILQNGRKANPTDRYLLFDVASIFNNKRDYKSLEPLLPQLLDFNANNTDIMFVAANCYDHLNEYEKAEGLYLRIIESNSSLYEPVYSIGLLYFRQSLNLQGDAAAKNISKAEEWLKKANEISPNSEKCLDVLKLVYVKTNNQNQINRIDNQLKQLTNP